MRGNGVFWGFTKRIPLLKQRNWRGNRAAGAETGCFGDLQNELRCKNNGIRGETAHLARKLGVFGIHKTNSVVLTTELGRDRAVGAEMRYFRDLQNELRCKNNGIRRETVRWTRERGVLGIYKTNSVVKTTEFAEKPCGGRGNWVFWGFTKRITL